jgi:hypothetical protein
MLKSLTIIYILLHGCNSLFPKNKRNDDVEIRCIKVTQIYPNLDNNGKLIKYDTSSVEIYYHQNLILYHLSYDFDSTFNGKLLLFENRDHYLVHKIGDNYGYNYNQFRPRYKTRVSIDSVLKTEWVSINTIYPAFTNYIAELISSDKNDDSGSLNEVYLLRSKIDSTPLANLSLGYTHKLRHLRYSLSEELDSIKGIKLYKVRFVNHSRLFKNHLLDRFEGAYDLQEVPVSNPKKIMSYFNMFKKEEDEK